MKKSAIIIACMLLLMNIALAQNAEPGESGLGDDYYPDLGNGGYDTLHYTLDLDWDEDSNEISGTVTIEAQALQDLSAFNLDFLGFEISELLLNDEPVDFERDDRELIITPPETLLSGEDFTVAVTYSGIPGEDIPTLESERTFARGWTRHARGVFVASEPSGAAMWYPVNDHPLDKATYTFEITVPKPYVVAANGQLQDEQDNGETRTFIWEAADEMASYLATVNIGQFIVQKDEGPDGLPIRNYVPPSLLEGFIRTHGRTPDMIAFFNDLIAPYPFEAYGVVVTDADIGFALETQTLSLFGRRTSEVVVAHELAHQWFGDSVSLVSWQDIWLNEGFATYLSYLWMEEQFGREALDAQLIDIYTQISDPSFVAGEFSPPGNPPPENIFNAGVYLRGAWTLHALRLRVGDEAFFDILRTYYDRFKYSNATTEDFIGVAEAVSGKDLSEFFQGWLYDEPIPDVPELGLKRPE